MHCCLHTSCTVVQLTLFIIWKRNNGIAQKKKSEESKCQWPLQFREMWLMPCCLSVNVQAGACEGATQPETSEFSRDINHINLCATKWWNTINPLQMLCARYYFVLWAHRLCFALSSVCISSCTLASFFIIFNFSLTENQICPSTKLPILKSCRE